MNHKFKFYQISVAHLKLGNISHSSNLKPAVPPQIWDLGSV